MNTKEELLQQAIRALPANCGATITPDEVRPSVGGADGSATLHAQGRKFRTILEIKRTLQPGVISHLSELNRKHGGRLLLIAAHVTPRYADLLAEAEIDFVDTAGNVLFQRDGVYIHVTGRKPEAAVLPDTRGRAFESNGLKLIYALLTDPNLNDPSASRSLLNQPYRRISAVTGISLGSVGWIMADLSAQGYVLNDRSDLRILTERRRLLARWVECFSTRLRRKLLVARYRSSKPRWWDHADPRATGGLWGGEVAAAKLTGYLSPGTVTIYAQALTGDFILDHDLRPDPDGPVTVLKPFCAEQSWASLNHCVHPLLVYADLTSSDIDRNLETARRIYETHLRPLLEPA